MTTFKRMQKLAGVDKMLTEAYDIYPTSEEEITDDNIKELFKTLKSIRPDLETPIALDSNKPKFVKVSTEFEKDKAALDALSNFTGLDFKAYASMLKTKNNQERQHLAPSERLNWNGINILFGSGAKNIPDPRKQTSAAKDMQDTGDKIRGMWMKGMFRENKDS